MSSWTGCTSISDANTWNCSTNMSFETALGARVHDARHAPSGPDQALGPAARKGAIAIDVARLGRQHRLQLSRIVDIGRRDLDPADQPGLQIGRNMRLVAVHGLAPAVAGLARLAIL